MFIEIVKAFVPVEWKEGETNQLVSPDYMIPSEAGDHASKLIREINHILAIPSSRKAIEVIEKRTERGSVFHIICDVSKLEELSGWPATQLYNATLPKDFNTESLREILANLKLSVQINEPTAARSPGFFTPTTSTATSAAVTAHAEPEILFFKPDPSLIRSTDNAVKRFVNKMQIARRKREVKEPHDIPENERLSNLIRSQQSLQNSGFKYSADLFLGLIQVVMYLLDKKDSKKANLLISGLEQLQVKLFANPDKSQVADNKETGIPLTTLSSDAEKKMAAEAVGRRITAARFPDTNQQEVDRTLFQLIAQACKDKSDPLCKALEKGVKGEKTNSAQYIREGINALESMHPYLAGGAAPRRGAAAGGR